MIGRYLTIARLSAALATITLIALGGCTTLGGNVKGNFSCAAPDGICAPSSSIDDRALAMIAGESGAAEALPATVVVDPRARTRPSRSAAAGPRVSIGQGDSRRTRERVLRIVFRPYIDEFGRLHESSAVHAVVEESAWQQQRLAGATPIPNLGAEPRPVATVSLAEAVDRADDGGADLASIDPNLPDPAVVAAARARAPAIDPVTAIRNDVAARLAPRTGRAPRRVVTKSVSRPSLRTASGAALPPSVVNAATTANMPAVARSAAPADSARKDTAKAATDAVTTTKATPGPQAQASAVRDVAIGAPAVSAPIRAGGFPGTVPEDD